MNLPRKSGRQRTLSLSWEPHLHRRSTRRSVRIWRSTLPFSELGRRRNTAVRKKKTYNIRLIRARRCYTMSEISLLLNVHVRTVQAWHKQEMVPIEPNDKPLLFLGIEIKRFLSNRQKARKCRLKENEFFCPRCKTPRASLPQGIRIVDTNRRIGKNDVLVLIRGLCDTCRCKLSRFSTRNKVKSSFWTRMVEQVRMGLREDSSATLNTDFKGDEKQCH